MTTKDHSLEVSPCLIYLAQCCHRYLKEFNSYFHVLSQNAQTVNKSTNWEALQFLPKETMTSLEMGADENASRTGLLEEEGKSLSLLTYATSNLQLTGITDYYNQPNKYSKRKEKSA